MNTKNNLHNALNKAFENHIEPLNEAQWVRLEGAITKKKKRRFLPFLYIFLLVSTTAVTTYFATLKYGVKQNNITYLTQSENLNSEKNSDITLNNEQLIAPKSSHSHTTTTGFLAKPSIKKHIKSETGLNKAGSNNSLSKINQIMVSENQKYTDSSPQNDMTSTTKENIIFKPVSENKSEETPIPEETQRLPDMALTQTNDTIYTGYTGKDKEEELKPPHSRFAFSLAAGYSKMKINISGMENGEKLHKDTRQLFEQSNDNLKTTFINFGFDLSVFPQLNIGLNSGIQYLKVAAPVAINYTLTEVPWREENGSISYYIPATNPINLNSSNTNYTTYLSIPLRCNYSINLNPKNEIVFTAGTNISMLVNARGKSVNINTGKNESPEVKSLNRRMYRPVNPGLAGGFQYNLQFKNRWWIGLENIWQATPMKYKVGMGSIKNKFEGYNVNFLIKYKI